MFILSSTVNRTPQQHFYLRLVYIAVRKECLNINIHTHFTSKIVSAFSQL